MYIPAALRRAFEVYLQLPRDKWPHPSENSFWIGGPPRIAQGLVDFCVLMEVDWKATPAVLRKLFVTTVGELVSEPGWNSMP